MGPAYRLSAGSWGQRGPPPGGSLGDEMAKVSSGESRWLARAKVVGHFNRLAQSPSLDPHFASPLCPPLLHSGRAVYFRRFCIHGAAHRTALLADLHGRWRDYTPRRKKPARRQQEAPAAAEGPRFEVQGKGCFWRHLSAAGPALEPQLGATADI